MKKSYKIAILNCYLQIGKKDLAESEAFIRFKIAAQNLGHEAKSFARSEDILEYNPDLVICHSYQDPKITQFPTYGTMTMPPIWVSSVERFLRNIATYDAYISISPSVTKFIDDIVTKKYDKQIPAVYAAFSVPKTEFVKLDYSNARATYMGTNWDGNRHGQFFSSFEEDDLLRCYGPKDKWNYLPKKTYGGEVPFDGKTFLKTYRQNGIGLCFNHKDFDFADIPTSRVFEIPASSALMIAADNNLVKSFYKDAAFYINPYCTDIQIAQQVKDLVKWTRSNQNKAQEMSYEANKIFNEKLSMEIFLQNLLDFHEKKYALSDNQKSKETLPAKKNNSADVTIVSTIDDINELGQHLSSINSQIIKPKAVFLINLTNNKKRFLKFLKPENKLLKIIENYSSQFEIKLFDENGKNKIISQKNILNLCNTSYINFVKSGDLLYPNHLQEIFAKIKEFNSQHDNPLDLIYSGASQYSKIKNLNEILKDPHLINRNEKFRILQIGELSNPRHIALASMFFNTKIIKNNSNEANFIDSSLNQIFYNNKNKIALPIISILIKEDS